MSSEYLLDLLGGDRVGCLKMSFESAGAQSRVPLMPMELSSDQYDAAMHVSATAVEEVVSIQLLIPS